MKKGIVSCFLALAMLSGLCVSAFSAEPTFSDVPAAHWAYDSVERAALDGVVNGVGNQKYAPDTVLSVTQCMVIMTRAFFPEEVAAADQSKWYSAGVEVARAKNLQSGTSVSYEFWQEGGSSAPCSRYDMAVILCNILHALNIKTYQIDSNSDLSAYAAQIADFDAIPVNYQRSVAEIISAGVLQGVDTKGTFSGNMKVSRAQAAAMYCRMADVIGDLSTLEERIAASYIAEVVRLVNEERAKEGLSALRSDDTALNEAAALRAQELPELFSHTRPNGTSCFTAMQEKGVSYRSAGENIAAGQRTPAAVVNAWMNSPGHRANILNAGYNRIGVGYATGDSGYGVYWAQMFAGG